jgi:hypothetical protein
MANIDIKNIWIDFMNKHKTFFMSEKEKWIQTLENIKSYIKENNKRPSSKDKNNKISKFYGCWLTTQNQNNKKGKHLLMDQDIKTLWEDFKNEYKEYFITNQEKWNYNLSKLKQYIDINNKRPSRYDNDDNIKKLGEFLQTQQKDMKKKNKSAKNDSNKYLWDSFIHDEKYKKFFMNNHDIFKSMLEKTKKYIDDNNKRPLKSSLIVEEKKMANWLEDRLGSHGKRKKESEQIIFKEFITDDKYKHFFHTK